MAQKPQFINWLIGSPQIIDLSSLTIPTAFTPTGVPSSVGNWNSYAGSFAGDNSNIALGIQYLITGTATLGEPMTGYEITPELTPTVTYMVNESGWNQDTGDNGGRTAAISNLTYLGNLGQGDAVAYFVNMYLGSQTKPGYTNWLANPAITAVAGGYFAGADGQFINPFEISSFDDGHDIAFIGYSVTASRTANSGALGVLPTGYWAFQANADSTNTKPWDAIIGGLNVPVNIGIDLTGIQTQASGTWVNAAIIVNVLDRIYFDGIPFGGSSAGPGNAANPGTEFIEGNGTGIVIVAGNIPAVQVYATETLLTTPIVSQGYTVATLPNGINAGGRAHVTNANATTFLSIVASGGSNIVPVFYNGTNWLIG